MIDNPSPPAYDLSEHDGRSYKIKLTDQRVVVVWKNSGQQIQHTSDLRIDLNVDVSEQQALITLHNRIFSQGSKPDSHILLCISPDDVESIKSEHTHPTLPEVAETDMFIPLRFSITKQTGFEIPQILYKPKQQSVQLISAVTSLASVRDFTIYFKKVDLVPEITKQLLLLPLIFSVNHLKPAKRREFTEHLHHLSGNQFVKASGPNPSSSSSIKETVEQPSPPPYIEKDNPKHTFTKSDRKRQRTSTPSSPSATKRVMLDLDQVAQHLNRLERRVGESIAPNSTHCIINPGEKEPIDDVQSTDVQIADSIEGKVTLQDLAQRMLALAQRVTQLEEMVEEYMTPTPRYRYRFNTEEEERIREIEDTLTGVQAELEDKVIEGTEQVEKVIEKHERYLNDAHEVLMGSVRQEVKNLMGVYRQELFTDIAALFRGAAHGRIEDASISFSAGSQASESA
ncbi:hypothetical protein QBC43DRAFT_288075 [Cladorrhinum sp. PSN259]|nr:hypothetical protein QBC43DRAFT_288075 [Cladorrhinum sp. PSN259]